MAQQMLPPPAAPVLPEELIVEILSRVPVKSLMRFRCVSTTWNFLIFHPTLVKLHLQRSSKNTHVLVRCRGIELFDEWFAACTMQGLFENPSSTIDDDCRLIDNHNLFVGSCHGLVCFIREEFEEYCFWFWNPATRIMFEDSPRLRSHSEYDLDPGNWGQQFLKFGFGYDELSDTYKVVLFLLDAKSENWEVKVHCLGDKCWRNILTCPSFPILGERDGQFVDGSVNWLAIQKSGYFYGWRTVKVNQLVILSYDLNKDTYRYFLMPDGLSEVLVEPDLRVLNGCLCLSYDHKRTHLVVWIMREFGVEKSWTQMLNVSYEFLQVLPYNAQVKPLCVSENDDLLLLADSSRYELILYNPRDDRINRTEGFNEKVPLSSYDFVPSLVLPYRN